MWSVNGIYPGLIRVQLANSLEGIAEDSSSNPKVKLNSLAFIGTKMKLSKVISLQSDLIWLESVESQTEIRLGDEVKFFEVKEITHLQPTYFGQAINLLGKVISENTNQPNSWDFIPVVQNGQSVQLGQKMGYCQIHDHLKFWLLASQNGQVQRISSSKCSFDSQLAQVNSVPQYFFTAIDYSDIYLQRLTQKPFITKISTLDLLYPVLIGSCSLISSPTYEVFEAFCKSESIDITIVINSDLQINLPFNTIQLVDTFGQPDLMIQSAKSLSKQLMAMNYRVLIWNNLEVKNGFEWESGEGQMTEIAEIELEAEQYSLTVVDTINNYQKYDNLLSFKDNLLQFDSSFLEDDIENYLVNTGNIQYLTDFTSFHSQVVDSPQIQELLDLKTELTLDILHQLVC
jgi:hypothetical protein